MAIDQEEIKRFHNDALNRRQADSAKENLAKFKKTWKLNSHSNKKSSTLFIWIAGVVVITFFIFKGFYDTDLKKGIKAYEHEEYIKAANLFAEACNKGNTDGCFNLGQMYDQGEGVVENDVKAVELYTKACNTRDFQGCYNLGMMYAYGHGVHKDKYKAVDLFDQACKGGEGVGCFNLAFAYTKGIAVKENKVTAMKLYSKACELGVDEGCGNYNYISKQSF